MSFTEKLYTYHREQDENFVLSPYSLRMALCMLREGAREQTGREMQILGEAPDFIDSEKLRAANAVWLNCMVDPVWRRIVEENYNAKTENISDLENPEETINKWCSDNTEGKIKNIVNNLNRDTQMVVTNAVYFKDNWLHRFSEENTEKDTFHAPNGDVEVDMMHMTWKLMYADLKEAQIVELPYEDPTMVMQVILPKEESGSLPSDLLFRGHRFNERKVRVSMPKLKMEFKFNLNDFLRSIGVREAFTDGADFKVCSGATKIGKVIQKTFIEVDEEGTEAAAATAVTVRAAGYAAPTEPIEFKVNRPYVFLIKDKVNNEVLFMGYINNPVLEENG